MALTYGRQFASTELAATATSIFTLSEGNIRNMTILLVNHTAGAITVTGHVVPSAGSVANSNMFISAESIGANSRLEVNVPQMIAGDDLQMFAGSASSITVHDLDSVIRT